MSHQMVISTASVVLIPTTITCLQIRYTYASITSSGIGTWTAATNTYPLDVNGGVTSSPYGSTTNTQCYSTNGYIYCVDFTSGGTMLGANFAALTSSGVGGWTSTKGYYTVSGSTSTYLIGTDCVTANGYIYCVGGSNPNNDNLPTDSSILCFNYKLWHWHLDCCNQSVYRDNNKFRVLFNNNIHYTLHKPPTSRYPRRR